MPEVIHFLRVNNYVYNSSHGPMDFSWKCAQHYCNQLKFHEVHTRVGRDFFAEGIEKLVPCLDKCLNNGDNYVEKNF
ncbi:unnamed protein product [Larinioides sclopetarius]|uniref:Uncharacterized protein n=1 Tax=Larinioides sclopetarius TaxID=280406 RepID=A0AAV2A2A4_9ARAC